MTYPDLDRVATVSGERLREATQRHGLCAQNPRHADEWFPPEPHAAAQEARSRYERTAARICAGCPVQAECLEFSLRVETEQRSWGIAGGLAPWQREELVRARRDRQNGAAA